MKNAINWRLFFILVAAGVITAVMVLPYTLALSPTIAKIFTPTVFFAQIIQSIILFSIAVFFGLYLGKRVGLGLPILEGTLKGENKTGYLKSILGLSIGLGVLAGVLIILFSFLFPSLSVSMLNTEIAIPTWKTLLASFYGGVGEELLLRFFVMTLLVWIFSKIKKTSDGHPTVLGIWIAIILTSIIFGLGHLPITGALAAITWEVVLRAILLNGVAGVIFGWLYWKKGLESAIISHFSADITLHVVLPIVAALVLGR